MKKKPMLSLLAALFLLLILGACSSDNEQISNEGTAEDNHLEDDSTNETVVNAEDEKENNLETEEPKESKDNEAVEATALSKNENTISFTRINWMLGAPPRKPEAGIWLYTEDDHPSSKTNTFNFEKNDVLLYQVGDEKYRGHVLRAQRIVLEDNDIARIVVRVHSKPDEEADPEELEMARQYLNVEKGALRGKRFIVETEDGEALSLN